ncbi:rac GTPase-activating protein 1 [Periophthalmus magnuspinnatus]|uniref:rac GTPase-activating protein 1 n=1 Tax=Periophthalmus magnuspinnatus TaxID=409849 RepID=UPI0024365729|nr:rac GTPase-activating protein 1 [Periophthalmus magnuspinnatus]
MGESRAVVEELLSLCLQRISLEQSSMNTEMEFLEMTKSFESMRRRCFTAESELKKYKELLVKSDVAKAALDVKLKHVRNQLDLEMQKRLRVERDFQYLQRQMQLMCDILVQDSKSSSCLNDEQKSLLATFEHKNQTSAVHKTSKRLSVIDESSFLSHSDISYDRTDDDVDLDSTVIKPLKSRARERRRSSMGVVSTANGSVGKRLRTNISTEIQTQVQDMMHLEKEVETIVKASVCTPESTQIHMVVGITQENSEQKKGSRPSLELAAVDADQTSVWCPSEETLEPETVTRTEDFFRTNSSSSTFSNICNRTFIQTPCKTDCNMNNNTTGTKHVFISKTVIRPESCYCCGKRMRFGKAVVKCRNCRVVVHPECKSKCPVGCSSMGPTAPGSQTKPGTNKPGSLESFCPVGRPRVPLLVVECISEIERRGLKERGLYRVPGGDRAVKELRERFLSGKTSLNLGKVEDVHAICGLLKDFLRKLPEPLITFRLHPRFMEAAELEDESGTVILYKAISELPPPNKDTLAIILLHLHKVMASAECHMDHGNLCRVFGPTLIGHALAEPSPTTIMKDTASQHKVMSRLLSVPVDYWKRVLSQTEQTPTSAPSLANGTPTCVKTTNQDEGMCRLFKPLTSPELSSYKNRQGSITGRLRNLGHAGNVGRGDPSRRFFTSPS